MLIKEELAFGDALPLMCGEGISFGEALLRSVDGGEEVPEGVAVAIKGLQSGLDEGAEGCLKGLSSPKTPSHCLVIGSLGGEQLVASLELHGLASGNEPSQPGIGLWGMPRWNAKLKGAQAERKWTICAGQLTAVWQRRCLEIAAQSLGIARASFESALEYTQERKAFGKPIAHFQAVAFMLADDHMALEGARWMLWNSASQLEAAENTLAAAVVGPWAGAIAHTLESAEAATQNAVQLFGGAGFMRDYPVEKWLRDCKELKRHLPSASSLDMLAGRAYDQKEFSAQALLPWENGEQVKL